MWLSSNFMGGKLWEEKEKGLSVSPSSTWVCALLGSLLRPCCSTPTQSRLTGAQFLCSVHGVCRLCAAAGCCGAGGGGGNCGKCGREEEEGCLGLGQIKGPNLWAQPETAAQDVLAVSQVCETSPATAAAQKGLLLLNVCSRWVQ